MGTMYHGQGPLANLMMIELRKCVVLAVLKFDSIPDIFDGIEIRIENLFSNTI